LREAVLAARIDAAFQGCPAGAPGLDSTVLGSGAFAPSLAGAGDDDNLTGDLDTGKQSVRIVGRGADVTAIDAGGIDRAFDVFRGATVALEDLAIRGGVAQPNDDSTFPGGIAGAARNLGALTVSRVTFAGNAAGKGGAGSMGSRGFEGGDGGAIWSGGASPTLTVTDSTFTGSRAGDGGNGSTMGAGTGGAGGSGGASLVDAGTATISGSTFAGNRAGDAGNGGADPPDLGAGGTGGAGGAIALRAGTTAVIATSTFAANRAGNGGLAAEGAGARSAGGDGGALHAAGAAASVEYSTFAGNAAGLGASGASGVQSARVAGSILADPRPGLQRGHRQPAAQCRPAGRRQRGDRRPRGAPCPATDQRGLPRPRLGGCDAGAVEVQTGPATAGAAPGPAAKARRVSGLRMRPAAFRAAGSGGSIGKLLAALARRRPIGTTVGYRLDGAARVTFTITKPAAGPRKGKRCVRPAAARPGARACLRQVKLRGSFVHQGAAGQNRFRFTGRLRRRALALGPYRLVARLPRPAAGRAALAATGFRIVR
jgi:hypothetical protein